MAGRTLLRNVRLWEKAVQGDPFPGGICHTYGRTRLGSGWVIPGKTFGNLLSLPHPALYECQHRFQAQKFL